MNTAKIVSLLRTGANAEKLILEDAGALTERLVSRTGLVRQRAAVVAYLTELHGEVALIVGREHTLRVTAALDGAEARSRWAMLRRVVAAVAETPDLPDSLRTLVDEALATNPEPLIPEDPDDDEQPSTAPAAASHSRR
jgi:hypothetical protein